MRTPKQLKKITDELHRLEFRGEYEAALEQTSEFWNDWKRPPLLEHVDHEIRPELLLRLGSLFGFHGHNRQIANAQEISLGLLNDARNGFIESGETRRVAECENYLALTFHRTGEFAEALNWCEKAFSHSLDPTDDIRLHSVVAISLILMSSGKYEEALEICARYESDFKKCDSWFLAGCFNSNLGLVLKNLGRTIEAIDKFEAARLHHKKSGNLIYLGTVENNLGQTYKLEKRFSDAIAAVSNAIEIYEILGDKARKGSSIDTKAQIYFEEGNYHAALLSAEEAIEILKNGENTSFLTEAYFTKAKILVHFDQVASATLTLMKALEMARTNVSEAAAEKLAKEFEFLLRKRPGPKDSAAQMPIKIYDGDLELVLPEEIANYDDYQVVRIKNSHLVAMGIQKDSLAVVVEETIKRGDLVVLTEIQDDSIVCGFYDYFAGIVSISGINSETLLFKTEEVRVVGKIIGVGNSEPAREGKIHIRPIEI